MSDFSAWCKTIQECTPQGVPYRDKLTELHNKMLAYIAELEKENERLRLDVTALLTNDSSRCGLVK